MALSTKYLLIAGAALIVHGLAGGTYIGWPPFLDVRLAWPVLIVAIASLLVAVGYGIAHAVAAKRERR